jgi:hypothetical protein
MTDIHKALAFAKECLKWESPVPDFSQLKTFVWSSDKTEGFELSDVTALQEFLETFLSNRFFIQINRGKECLFKWRVIVGLQNLAAPGARHDHALGDGDDLYDAIFDACVAAARLFP